MNLRHCLLLLGLATAAAARADTGGPFIVQRTNPDATVTRGVRPFWIETRTPAGELRAATSLFPIFSYRADEETYAWSVFELIKRSGRKPGAPAPQSVLAAGEAFDVWPFWFSREARDPADSYQALFPISGTVKNRLGYERLSWTLFPFYVQTEKRGATTTATPWPFIRTTRGTAQGFAVWPLFGWQERPGVSRDEFYLWPLGYRRVQAPPADAPAGTPPARQIAALPFYARETSAGFVSENFLWPFFGYTDRTAPTRYHETRYFWPFLVQAQGEDRFVNRWAPFYTHSLTKGVEKTWIGWPLFREARWTSDELVHTKTQFLYVLYWKHEQRSARHPTSAPAHVTHVWPLFSTWDNGAGRRQILALSPFEVFFPGNQKVRDAWAPFFSLYRYDERAPGQARHSLLWDIVSWETRAAPRTAAAPTPAAVPEERLTLGRGLVGLRRPAGERAWRLVLLDFAAKPTTVAAPTASADR